MQYDPIREFDRFSKDYINNRDQFENAKQLAMLCERLAPLSGKRILELGCGAGSPVLKTFADKESEVVGVDFSAQMIEAAKKNLPQAQLYHQDMTTVSFNKNSFDAILSFYAIFVLPLEKQFAMFEKIYQWLKVKGITYFTLFNEASTQHKEFSGFIEFLGYQFFYAHTTPEKYQEKLESIGFKNVRWENIYIRENDHCLWFFAEK